VNMRNAQQYHFEVLITGLTSYVVELRAKG
jgi:hypothetical protein